VRYVLLPSSCPAWRPLNRGVAGKLVKILVHTKATRYLNFKQIDGSFVYKSDKSYVAPPLLRLVLDAGG
jgi:hypothetical protein